MTLELFPQPDLSPLHFEERANGRGYRKVAGVDEAGRGPLAGPVVAAAVILPEGFELPGLTDSKQLTAARREEFYPQIRARATAIGIGVVGQAEIDRVNILQATLQGMILAIGRLRTPADYLLVDGITPLPLAVPQNTLKKGDSRSLSVAAASVVAKVVRDRIMTIYDRRYPGYGFARHKGYATADHLSAISRLGPCRLHRRTFCGVKEHLEDE